MNVGVARVIDESRFIANHAGIYDLSIEVM
jgi:hypothetical protein